MKPFAYITETYDWEGDPAVRECLVFFSGTAIGRFEREKDAKHATLKLRAVKNENRHYIAEVRCAATKELMIEYDTICFINPYHAIDFMKDKMLCSFEWKDIQVEWLPNQKL